jgi:hypothetical protein
MFEIQNVERYGMTEKQIEFEVLNVTEEADLHAVVLHGRVSHGQVKAGMTTKVWVDGGLYMKASIKAVEHEGSSKDNTVQLVLDAPEPEVRELWLGLCQAGDVLPIEESV